MIISTMHGRLPLPTLLSHALVAFTIEFDNEFEHRMAHRTTRHGLSAGPLEGPWLVSLVMWPNCMQFLGEEGLSVGELERRARTRTNLAGMERWGYVFVEPDPSDRWPKPPRSAALIRATPAGRKARQTWRPLFNDVEKRWRERFGDGAIEELRASLWAVADQLDVQLPDCVPILKYGLYSGDQEYERRSAGNEDADGASRLSLSALLSRVLLAFAIDFERKSELSLATGANVVRILDEKGVRARDLPQLTGVSKEAISMAMGILRKKRVAVVETEKSGSRTKVIRLTASGRESQDAYRQLLRTIEERWDAAIREADDPPPERVFGAVGRRRDGYIVTVVPRVRTVSRRLAGFRAQARNSAALSYGTAPRRIPRWQLSQPSERIRVPCSNFIRPNLS